MPHDNRGPLTYLSPMTDAAFQQCINPACGSTYAVDEARVACTKCGGLLDIKYDWAKLPKTPKSLTEFESRWAVRRAAKKQQQEREEQENIDAILAKVSASGMNSLTWWEKRTLQRATERQRKADADREAKYRRSTR